MKLTTQQAYALLEKRGCYIREICDHCGTGIGPVRFTRKDDLGVWCSHECRDGKKVATPTAEHRTCLECGSRLKGKRADSQFCSDTHKMRYYRHAVRSRTSQNSGNSRNTPIQNTPLTDTQNTGIAHPTSQLEKCALGPN
jgi:hypothetical protein